MWIKLHVDKIAIKIALFKVLHIWETRNHDCYAKYDFVTIALDPHTQANQHANY